MSRLTLGDCGDVVTFYSYKGGTGRSMSLVNCAGLIAARLPTTANPLLLIDFDLEAPGLHRYLAPFLTGMKDRTHRHGLLECCETLATLIDKHLATGALSRHSNASRLPDEIVFDIVDSFDLTPYIIPTSLPQIHLMPAGRFDKTYDARLTSFNWHQLFAKAPALFRHLGDRLSRTYTATFIDARTGLSDTSGICTTLLPNVLVVVFTPNTQSLTGIEHLVRSALAYRKRAADLRELRIYPLPSRVDNQVEHFRRLWRMGGQHSVFGSVSGYQPMFEALFQDSMQKATGDPAARLNEYFDLVQIPHAADYAYGERLCFTTTSESDSLSMRRAYEQFLPWLTSGAQPWEQPAQLLLDQEAAAWLRRSGAADRPREPSNWTRWFDALATGILSTQHTIAVAHYDQLSTAARFDVALTVSLTHAYRQDFRPALDWLARAHTAFVDDLSTTICQEAPTQLLSLWSEVLHAEELGADLIRWIHEADRLLARWQPIERDRKRWLLALGRIAAKALPVVARKVLDGGDFHEALISYERLTDLLRTALGEDDALTTQALETLRRLRTEFRHLEPPQIHVSHYSVFLSYASRDDAESNLFVTRFANQLELAISRYSELRHVPPVFRAANEPGSGDLEDQLRRRMSNSFVLMVIVHHAYVGSERCAQDLRLFRTLFGKKGADRLYIVALSQSAIDTFRRTPEWKELSVTDSIVYNLFDPREPERPIQALTSHDMLSPQFRDRVNRLAKTLATQMAASRAIVTQQTPRTDEGAVQLFAIGGKKGTWEQILKLLDERWRELREDFTSRGAPLLRVSPLDLEHLEGTDGIVADGIIVFWELQRPRRSLVNLLAAIERSLSRSIGPSAVFPGIVITIGATSQQSVYPELPWSAARCQYADHQIAIIGNDVSNLDGFLLTAFREYRKRLTRSLGIAQ